MPMSLIALFHVFICVWRLPDSYFALTFMLSPYALFLFSDNSEVYFENLLLLLREASVLHYKRFVFSNSTGELLSIYCILYPSPVV